MNTETTFTFSNYASFPSHIPHILWAVFVFQLPSETQSTQHLKTKTVMLKEQQKVEHFQGIRKWMYNEKGKHYSSNLKKCHRTRKEGMEYVCQPDKITHYHHKDGTCTTHYNFSYYVSVSCYQVYYTEYPGIFTCSAQVCISVTRWGYLLRNQQFISTVYLCNENGYTFQLWLVDSIEI